MGSEQRKRTWLLSRMNPSTKVRTVGYAEKEYFDSLSGGPPLILKTAFARQRKTERSSTDVKSVSLFRHAITRRTSAHFDLVFGNAKI